MSIAPPTSLKLANFCTTICFIYNKSIASCTIVYWNDYNHLTYLPLANDDVHNKTLLLHLFLILKHVLANLLMGKLHFSLYSTGSDNHSWFLISYNFVLLNFCCHTISFCLFQWWYIIIWSLPIDSIHCCPIFGNKYFKFFVTKKQLIFYG